MLAKLLPYHAALMLVRATEVGRKGSKERRIAIDDATEKIKKNYPERFRAPVLKAGGQ